MSFVAHLWQSTLCVAVATLLAVWFRRAPARLRYRIWIAAAAKFLVPFSALVAAGRIAGESTMPATPLPAAFHWLQRSFSALAAVPGATVEHSLSPRFLASIGMAWLTGACAVAAWRWLAWHHIGGIARTASVLRDGREYAALQRALRRATRSRSIELRSSRGKVEPAALGIVRARVLWPAALTSRLNDCELDAIMAHEVCHVVHRDNVVGLLRVVVETLFWFHPVVWWIGGRLAAERERACDEEVLQMGLDRRTYAGSILEVCRFCLCAPAAVASGVGQSNLARRIERIMKDQPIRMTAGSRATIAGISLVLLACPLGIGALSANRAPEAARPAVQEPASGEDRKNLVMPRLIKEVKPVYTEEAKQERIQGSVLMRVVVEADGTVGDVEVTKSLDAVHGLDDEAIRAVRQWRFSPARKDGKPVTVSVDIEMTFTLK